jgi:hypothetical protein
LCCGLFGPNRMENRPRGGDASSRRNRSPSALPIGAGRPARGGASKPHTATRQARPSPRRSGFGVEVGKAPESASEKKKARVALLPKTQRVAKVNVPWRSLTAAPSDEGAAAASFSFFHNNVFANLVGPAFLSGSDASAPPDDASLPDAVAKKLQKKAERKQKKKKKKQQQQQQKKKKQEKEQQEKPSGLTKLGKSHGDSGGEVSDTSNHPQSHEARRESACGNGDKLTHESSGEKEMKEDQCGIEERNQRGDGAGEPKKGNETQREMETTENHQVANEERTDEGDGKRIEGEREVQGEKEEEDPAREELIHEEDGIRKEDKSATKQSMEGHQAEAHADVVEDKRPSGFDLSKLEAGLKATVQNAVREVLKEELSALVAQSVRAELSKLLPAQATSDEMLKRLEAVEGQAFSASQAAGKLQGVLCALLHPSLLASLPQH